MLPPWLGPAEADQKHSRGRLIATTQHSLNDVIDISEIPLHLAVVEHLDRFTREDGTWKSIGAMSGGPRAYTVKNLRPLPPINHRRGGCGCAHQLIGLLAGGIEAHRMVHRLLLMERQIAVSAIHRTARGIDGVSVPWWRQPSAGGQSPQDCSGCKPPVLQGVTKNPA